MTNKYDIPKTGILSQDEDNSNDEGTVYAWHFIKKDNILRDGTIVPDDNIPLEFTGKLALCKSGLHASIKPIDALKHATGTILCYVKCEGEILFSDDELVCSKRTIIMRLNVEDMLTYTSRMFALSCAHLWNAPVQALDFLFTGDKSIPLVTNNSSYHSSYHSYYYYHSSHYSYYSSYSYSYSHSSLNTEDLEYFYNDLIAFYFFGE